jgi:glycerol-3-phosphate acyltransferase PlsY
MNEAKPVFSLIAILIAYLLGSISFGLLISKRRGINLRDHGSGNIGATNVFRVIGKREGILTLTGDVLKGTLAVGLARLLAIPEPWLACIAFVAILGHNFPLFLRFKGGKGVATTFGVLFGYMPWVGLLLVLIWGGAFLLSRISAVGALTVSIMLPFLVVWMGMDSAKVWFALSVALMMIVRHKDNIRRLLRREGKPC